MPRTRPLDSYPNAEFSALIREVLRTGAPVQVPCTRLQAASLRGEMYAWRRAVDREPIAAELIGCPTVAEARSIAFRINDFGMEAIPASTLQNPSLIIQALGTIPPLISPVQAALERLRGLTSPEQGYGS